MLKNIAKFISNYLAYNLTNQSQPHKPVTYPLNKEMLHYSFANPGVRDKPVYPSF